METRILPTKILGDIILLTPYFTRRLLEFSILVDSFILNESIYVLPSFEHRYQPFKSNDFVDYLINNGILKVLPNVELEERALNQAKELIGHLGNDNIYSYKDLGDSQSVIGDIEYMVRDISLHRIRKDFTSRDVEEFIRIFNRHLHFFLSPANDYVVHQIRNIMYWVIGEQLKIPYQPDAFRIEWINNLNMHWRKSIAQTLYKKIADSFVDDVKDVTQDHQPIELVMPQLTTYVIEKAKAKENLFETMMDI
ncbi:MAG: hypothetical protein HQ539_00570 [Parcubacteria group bacterium]|nr:hypothetical protein [Parcubacteria group bacterium]